MSMEEKMRPIIYCKTLLNTLVMYGYCNEKLHFKRSWDLNGYFKKSKMYSSDEFGIRSTASEYI